MNGQTGLQADAKFVSRAQPVYVVNAEHLSYSKADVDQLLGQCRTDCARRADADKALLLTQLDDVRNRLERLAQMTQVRIIPLERILDGICQNEFDEEPPDSEFKVIENEKK